MDLFSIEELGLFFMVSSCLQIPKIGLALGSGSARGWAHIGVIRELQAIGVPIAVVAGCSIGSLVGGAFAQNKLDLLETWVLKITKRQIAGFMDPSFGSGGIIGGTRIINVFREMGLDGNLLDFAIPFAAVATEMTRGEEIWLEKGSFLDLVRASASLPGFLAPYFYENRWLIDGGIVNPVPVALARKLGCSKVIAVNLNDNLLQPKKGEAPRFLWKGIGESSRRVASFFLEESPEKLSEKREEKSKSPGYRHVIWAMMTILQDRVTRYRMQIEPAEIELVPKLSKIGMMDFHIARSSIEEGRRIVRENAALILRQIEATGPFSTLTLR